MSRIRTIKPELVWSDESTAAGSSPYWIYCIAEDGCHESGPCKIGIATNIEKRLSSLQGGNWRILSLAWVVRLANRDLALAAEEYCLTRLRPNCYDNKPKPRLASEWVTAPPRKVLNLALMRLDADDCVVRQIA